MEEKKLVPKLRFPGFTEPWEQRKLGEIVERVTRKNNGQSDRPLTISAQDGLVDQCEYFDRQVASRDMSNYYLIKKGEFAYNKSYSDGYPFGAIKRLDYYDKGALSTLYIIFKIVDDRIGSDFMVAYYMTSLWYKEISKRAAEGARNHGLLNISTEDFFNSELKIPNDIKEQIKVGKFVNQFDQYITLHQRKLEHLKLKKKSLLQKLFPKEGEVYPELRFPGFTAPWEQRKLGEEAIEILAGGDIEKEKVVYDSGYPIYANALTNDGLVGYYTDYYRVEAPAVTVTGRGEVGHAQARSQNFTPIVRLLAIRSKHDCYFLENAINNYKTIVESTGVPQLTVPQLSAYKLCFPLNIEEEKRISICFQNLDTLITLHQRKLEHLQLLKKALLQQLFV